MGGETQKGASYFLDQGFLIHLCVHFNHAIKLAIYLAVASLMFAPQHLLQFILSFQPLCGKKGLGLGQMMGDGRFRRNVVSHGGGEVKSGGSGNGEGGVGGLHVFESISWDITILLLLLLLLLPQCFCLNGNLLLFDRWPLGQRSPRHSQL